MKSRLATVVSLIAILSLATTACLSSKDVREIVDASNESSIARFEAERLAAEVPMPDAPGDEAWKETFERIDAYIAAHPDHIRTIAALRLRQGVLAMNHGAYNMSRAAFAEVNVADLSNERDRAILEAHDAFLFWNGLNGGAEPTTLNGPQSAAAKRHIKDLTGTADALPATSTTRRMLEQIRVRMAVLVGRNLADADSNRGAILPAIDRYAAVFAGEADAVKCFHVEDGCDGAPVPPSNQWRWYDYYPCAFVLAKDSWVEDAGAAGVTVPFDRMPDWVDDGIAEGCRA